jgi:uncharacterized repeat protein (TIGR03943 family)
MAHDHQHHHEHNHSHGNTYYVDQLCTIGACGLMGGVCLMMYLDGRLKYILTPFFFVPVLVGGLALMLMAAVRAVTLWRDAGKVSACAHDHDHGHDHEHGHDHVHACGHDHGHEHGWTPARYAVLMIPVALFFFNLPNGAFSADAYSHMMSNVEIEGGAKTVASKAGPVLGLGFKELSNAARDSVTRSQLEGKTGRLTGMYQPSPQSQKTFTLFRVKMSCCAADAIPVGVVIACDENITQFPANTKQWVEAEGQIQFLKARGQNNFIPVLYMKSAKMVKPIDPPASEYGLD